MADNFGNVGGNFGSPTDNYDVTFKTESADAQKTAQRKLATSETVTDNLKADQDEGNPIVAALRGARQQKKDPLKRVSVNVKKGATQQDKIAAAQQMEGKAKNAEQRNPELKAKALLNLREQLNPDDSPEIVLRKTRDFYPDPTLADDALDFLLETMEDDPERAQKIKDAKEQLNKESGREIKAGRNIADSARQAPSLGTPTDLRGLYRDITINPREDPKQLFQELSDRYNYNDLLKVVKFLHHCLGRDANSKGPSIDKGELHILIRQIRSLQAILTLFRYFKGRMRLLQSLFARNGLSMPPKLTFELMAKQFMSLCSERYPSPEKVQALAIKLGIEKSTMAKIFVFAVFRDGVREVPRDAVFGSLEGRNAVFDAIIEASEDCEDQLEDELAAEDDGEDEDGMVEEKKIQFKNPKAGG